MDFQDQVKVGRLHLCKAFIAQDAGVVNQDMDAAPSFLRLCNHFHHLVIFGDAATVCHCFAASSLDLFDDLRRRVRRAGAIACTAQIIDHNLRAAPRQFERIGFAQPAARTGHNSDFVLKADGH